MLQLNHPVRGDELQALVTGLLTGVSDCFMQPELYDFGKYRIPHEQRREAATSV